MLRNIRSREIGKKVNLPTAKSFIIKEINRLDKEIARKLFVGMTNATLRDQIKLEITELKRQIVAHRKFLFKSIGYIVTRKDFN
jgi:hypothetical protein